MRLAVFSYGLPVPGEKRGGIERAAHTLAQGLALRGHHVVVFSHDNKPTAAAYDVRELPWKSFVNTWLGRRLTRRRPSRFGRRLRLERTEGVTGF